MLAYANPTIPYPFKSHMIYLQLPTLKKQSPLRRCHWQPAFQLLDSVFAIGISSSSSAGKVRRNIGKWHRWIHIVPSQTLVRAQRFTQIKSSIPLGAEDGGARPPITTSSATEYEWIWIGYVCNVYVYTSIIMYCMVWLCIHMWGTQPATHGSKEIRIALWWSSPLRERRVTQPRPGWTCFDAQRIWMSYFSCSRWTDTKKNMMVFNKCQDFPRFWWSKGGIHVCL